MVFYTEEEDVKVSRNAPPKTVNKKLDEIPRGMAS